MNLFKIKNNSATIIPASKNEKSERKLEELIENNPHVIFGKKLLLIGRQVKTDSGKILDLLALDKKGRLVVIELKRGYAPREIVAQVLDYSSWLSSIPERRIEDIAKNYFQNKAVGYTNLSDIFVKFYGVNVCPELGGEVINILFAKKFSEEVINPAKYLSNYDVEIYCIRFELFENEAGEYIITDNVVGDFDDYYVETNDIRNDKTENRAIVKKLVTYMQENYSKDCSETRFEKLYDFKLYQSRDGERTSAYIDWVYDDGSRFLIGIGVYSGKEGLQLYSHLRSRSRSKGFYSKVHSENAKKILSEYEDYSDNGKVWIGRYKEVNSINFNSIKNFSDIEISRLLDFINGL